MGRGSDQTGIDFADLQRSGFADLFDEELLDAAHFARRLERYFDVNSFDTPADEAADTAEIAKLLHDLAELPAGETSPKLEAQLARLCLGTLEHSLSGDKTIDMSLARSLKVMRALSTRFSDHYVWRHGENLTHLRKKENSTHTACELEIGDDWLHGATYQMATDRATTICLGCKKALPLAKQREIIPGPARAKAEGAVAVLTGEIAERAPARIRAALKKEMTPIMVLGYAEEACDRVLADTLAERSVERLSEIGGAEFLRETLACYPTHAPFFDGISHSASALVRGISEFHGGINAVPFPPNEQLPVCFANAWRDTMRLSSTNDEALDYRYLAHLTAEMWPRAVPRAAISHGKELPVDVLVTWVLEREDIFPSSEREAIREIARILFYRHGEAGDDYEALKESIQLIINAGRGHFRQGLEVKDVLRELLAKELLTSGERGRWTLRAPEAV